MKECWLPVPGFAGLYEVSDKGRVRSLSRNGTLGGILKPDHDAASKHSYPRVNLSKSNRQRKWPVHRLVLAAFVGPKPRGKIGNHKNGQKADSRLRNLEYITKRQNSLHAVRVLNTHKEKGSRHGMHKLIEAQVLEIRRRLAAGEKQQTLATRFHVNVPSISLIQNRKTWRHI